MIVLFYFFIFCVFLVDAIVCVYVSIQLYCSCCHYGVIKHDDDDDDCVSLGAIPLIPV